MTERRDAMFRGERINMRERRAVLQAALRAPRGELIVVDGQTRPRRPCRADRMAAFATRERLGDWLGDTGRRIRNVINVGIGGSYLGPEMAYLALRPTANGR